MNLLDRFENKIIIKGILKTTTPLHIGGGKNEFLPTEVDNAVIRDENNNPFIPGSSLKGVIRSYLERLFNSVEFEKVEGTGEYYKGCNILHEPCISNKKIQEIKGKYKNDLENDKKIALEIYKKQCDLCRVFGGKSFASKIQFSDARLIGTEVVITQKNGVGIDRDTLTAAKGINYTFETVGTGTSFDFEVTIDNLDNDHKDIVTLIISLFKNGDIRIGGKTSGGLGGIVLENTEVYKVTKSNMREYFLKGITKENKNIFMEDAQNV